MGSIVPPSAQFLPEAIALPLVHHLALFRLLQATYFDRYVTMADAGEPYPGWYNRHVDKIVNWAEEHGAKLVVLAMAPHVLADPATCLREEQTPGYCKQHEDAYRRFTTVFRECRIRKLWRPKIRKVWRVHRPVCATRGFRQ